MYLSILYLSCVLSVKVQSYDNDLATKSDNDLATKSIGSCGILLYWRGFLKEMSK